MCFFLKKFIYNNVIFNMPKNTKSEKVVKEATVEVSKEVSKEASVGVKSADKKTKSQKSSAPVPVPEPVPVPVPEPALAPEQKSKSSKKTSSKSTPVTETKKEEPVSVTETAQEGGKRRVRYFRCIYSDDTFGRFSGYKPKQAAGKALTSILRHREKEGKDLFEEVPFSMIECTRGGNHKVSQYTGKRVKLSKPVTVTIKTSDGKKKEINYNFTNKITKIKSEKRAVKKATTKKATTKKVATKKVAAKKVATKKVVKKTNSTTGKKVATKKSSTKKADA